MTHEELLAKINNFILIGENANDDGWLLVESVKALRAVVELHKPDDYNECGGCDSEFPCITIQAIEKELGASD